MSMSNKYKKILKNEEGRVITTNFSYLFLLQIASYLFPLVTMPYLARVIGAEGFGRIAIASAVIMWIQTISDWGFNYTATRDVAKNREDKDMVSHILSNVIWAKFILLFLSFFILLLLIYFVPIFRENYLVILITFLMVPGHILFPDWFFQALERMKYITILNLLSKLLFTIAIFVFIKEKTDYIYQPLFVSLGFILSGIISLYYIFVKWEYKFYKPELKSIFITIKGSTNVFINNIAPNLYNSFSVVLLGIYSTSIQNGIYDAGKKFTTIIYNFMNIFTRVFFPYFSRKSQGYKVYAISSILLSVFLVALIIILAPFLINIFFGSEFADSVIILRITAVSLIFLMIDSVFGINFLLVKGYDKILRNITIVSSIIGFLLAFPLVKYFSAIGVAVVYTFTSALIGVGSMIYACKIKKKNRCI
ncbi:MAG: oligosaccharide flippase family protein [Paludibacteraceae bacterium]|nr:oligosaccharide flippase family protein [Paludibacteraceae bacterium]